MANPGIPTSRSHGQSIDSLLSEINAIIINAERLARESRIAMAAGPVSDLSIEDIWKSFSYNESRLLDIATRPDLKDDFANYRGLLYSFHCATDVDDVNDKITGLPTNHKFKTDHRLKFKLIDGALPTGLTETGNFWARTVDQANGTITISATEGGGSDINLTDGSGHAEMYVNIKPDYQSLLVAVDAILDEIEANLTLRAYGYDRANLTLTYSTRTTAQTATLRTKFSDLEALIDTVEV